ncbi:MAG: DAK2 domain-containing protein [Treponema sp.]|nr:DAK2 domain-containing protein [Treponema sp.]
MAVSKINGNDFERMLKAALTRFKKHEPEINDMNVFPVPDGDTGTNMRLTLQNGILTAASSPKIGEYLKGVKKGTLLGARGNSGVILSQFFSGLSNSLADRDEASSRDFFEALVCAYQTAYKSVINPVEGTMLTVARLGVENIRSRLESFDGSVDSLLSEYIREMDVVLKETPEMLPILKESGVIDSGACGYVYMVQGMLYGLLNPDQDFEVDLSVSHYGTKENVSSTIESDNFTRTSVFQEGYCTEFILQLMDGSSYSQDFEIEAFREKLKEFGSSIVAFQEDSRVKVHIHTLKPHRVIEFAQQYGEFVTFKMDNMQIQKNEHEVHINSKKTEKKHKDVAVIAVVNGDGIRDLFQSFNCDVILDGGSTMNTSAQEFVEAYKSLDADHIVVLPNSRNVMFAAKQAMEISKITNISILETETMLEGYYALAIGQIVTENFEERLDQMKEGAESVDVISLAPASKPYNQNGISCEKGDCIALYKGDLISVGKDIKYTISQAIKKVPGIDLKDSCIIASGKNATDEMTEELENTIQEILPDVEISVVQGGQDVHTFMVGF